MEKDLRDRLDKLVRELPSPAHIPENLLKITILTLEAIRAHIGENASYRYTDFNTLTDAIEVVKDYLNGIRLLAGETEE
jgi:hypothetical protein